MNKLIFQILTALLLLLPSVSMAEITELVMPGPLIEGHAKIESKCILCHKLFNKEYQRKLCLDCHKLVSADIEAKQGFHGRSQTVGQSECRDCHTDHTGREADIVLLDIENFDHRNTDFELKGAHRQVHCSRCHRPELIKAEILDQPGSGPWSLHKHRNAPDQCVDCHKGIEPHQGRLGDKCQDCHQTEKWSTNSFNHEKATFKLEGAHTKVACSLCHPQQDWKKIPNDCYSCHRLNDNHAGRYGNKCQTCHTPKGKRQDTRGENISPWKTILFDHNTTRFPLRDKHLRVQCDFCHPKTLYNQKLQLNCASCHQTEDLHRGRFGDKCEGCHKSSGWKEVKFEHDKTKFPLRDKHAALVCNKCHIEPAADKKLPLDCYGCHKLDDAHRGQQGEQCDRCHNQRGWQAGIRFDHDLTRFPLIGLHAVSACEGCHIETTFKNTPHDCITCHRQSDEHKLHLGSNCAGCHNPNGWSVWEFNHRTQTKFRLEGAHETLECLACHREPVTDKISLGKACGSCHQKDDIHRGSFGRSCERCHQSTTFKQIRITQ